MMTTMAKKAILLIMALFTTTAWAKTHYDPKAYNGDPEAINMVGTNEVSATLVTDKGNTRVSGRMSLSLNASGRDLEQGLVQVGGWNMALFSVPQRLISGTDNVKTPEGVLGFAAKSNGTSLRYDRKTNTLMGEIKGYIDSAYHSTLTKKAKDPYRENDFFETVTQPAILYVTVALEKELIASGEKVDHAKARISAMLKVESVTEDQHILPAYQIEVEMLELEYQIAPWWIFESAKNLCVQPVRIGRLKLTGGWPFPTFTFETTGDGLAFGQPGVKTQWDKADVTFTYRDWKTLLKPSYWVTSDAGTEEANLRAEVDDDDCIEVFFVYDFDPVDAHGGGAAWGGGTAGSKIITSDANARNGVDFTHLAHELGHVIGLHHPWASATANLYPASTGTLMCGSGFNNDNPTVNSQENKDNVSNPLLTFSLKLRTAAPDCQNDVDCGACP